MSVVIRSMRHVFIPYSEGDLTIHFRTTGFGMGTCF